MKKKNCRNSHTKQAILCGFFQLQFMDSLCATLSKQNHFQCECIINIKKRKYGSRILYIYSYRRIDLTHTNANIQTLTHTYLFIFFFTFVVSVIHFRMKIKKKCSLELNYLHIGGLKSFIEFNLKQNGVIFSHLTTISSLSLSLSLSFYLCHAVPRNQFQC